MEFILDLTIKGTYARDYTIPDIQCSCIMERCHCNHFLLETFVKEIEVFFNVFSSLFVFFYSPSLYEYCHPIPREVYSVGPPNVFQQQRSEFVFKS
jgi:hypothetical protein